MSGDKHPTGSQALAHAKPPIRKYFTLLIIILVLSAISFTADSGLALWKLQLSSQQNWTFSSIGKPTRLCLYVQSHGVDKVDGINYTLQRHADAETWAKGFGIGSNADISVSFVTDGHAPPNFERISLNTTDLSYWDGYKSLWLLLEHLQAKDSKCDFYGLTDSDAYLQPNTILRSLHGKDPNDDLYAGYAGFGGDCTGMESVIFVHGALMLFSKKTMHHTLRIEKCPTKFNAYFDVNVGCCLYNISNLTSTSHGRFIIENTDVREWYRNQTDFDRACALGVHKVIDPEFMYYIHEDVQSLHGNTSYECN